MPERRTNETVLRANRGRAAFRLVLGVVVLAVSSYFSVYLVYPEGAPVIIPCVVIIVTYAAFAPLLRLLLTGEAIILTDEGLLARIGDVDFVAWPEIEAVEIEEYGHQNAVALHLRDPKAVLGRLSPVRRMLLRHHMKKGGHPLLYGSFVEGGAEHLLELIQKRIA
jgi:hypothetical protein